MFRLLAHPALHFLQDFLTMFRWPSGTSRILQAIQALARKTAAPLAYRDFGNLQGGGDLLIGLSRSRGQDNATAQRHRLRSRRRPRQVVQRGLHHGIEFDGGCDSRHASL